MQIIEQEPVEIIDKNKLIKRKKKPRKPKAKRKKSISKREDTTPTRLPLILSITLPAIFLCLTLFVLIFFPIVAPSDTLPIFPRLALSIVLLSVSTILSSITLVRLTYREAPKRLYYLYIALALIFVIIEITSLIFGLVWTSLILSLFLIYLSFTIFYELSKIDKLSRYLFVIVPIACVYLTILNYLVVMKIA